MPRKAKDKIIEELELNVKKTENVNVPNKKSKSLLEKVKNSIATIEEKTLNSEKKSKAKKATTSEKVASITNAISKESVKTSSSVKINNKDVKNKTVPKKQVSDKSNAKKGETSKASKPDAKKSATKTSNISSKKSNVKTSKTSETKTVTKASNVSSKKSNVKSSSQKPVIKASNAKNTTTDKPSKGSTQKTAKKVAKSATKKADATASKSTSKKTNTTTSKNTSKKTNTTASESSTKKASQKSSAKTKKANTKKTTSTKKSKNFSIEYYDLPNRYNQTIVKILAQTPTILFVYWDIADNDREKFIKQYGENFFYDTSPFLLITNKTKNYQYEVEIDDYANSWYLHIPDSDCEYEVTLIRKNKYEKVVIENNFLPITSSNKIEMPNDHILFEKLGKTIFLRDTKTNVTLEKDISSISYINKIGTIYNIYDLYKEIYKDELVGDELGTKLPSSQFSSNFK